MRPLASGILLALTSLVGESQEPSFLAAIERYRLPNGLTVILAPDASVTHASVELWVPAGTRYDPPGQRGTAHLLEHVSAARGAAIDTAGRRRAAPRMPDSNAQVRRDHARYFLLVDPTALDAGLAIHAARLAVDAGGITDSVVRAHADIVVNEGRTGVTAPATRGVQPYWRLQQGAYGADHPYGLAGETEASVRSITAADLRRFTGEFASARDAVLLVVGAFDPAWARERIALRFGALAPGEGMAVRATRLLPARRAWRRERMEALHGPPRLTRRFVVPPLGDADLELAELALRAALPEWVRLAGDALRTAPRLSLEPGMLASDLTVEAELSDSAELTHASAALEAAIAHVAALGTRPAAAEALTATLREARAEARGALLSLLDALGFQRSRSEQIGEGVFFADDPAYVRLRLERYSTASAREIGVAADEWLRGHGYELGLVAGPAGRGDSTLGIASPIVLQDAAAPRVAITRDTVVHGVRLVVTETRSLPLVRASVSTTSSDSVRVADATRQRAREDVASLWPWIASLKRPRAGTTIFLTGAIDMASAARGVAGSVGRWPAGNPPLAARRPPVVPGVRIDEQPMAGNAQAQLRVEWRVPTRTPTEELMARVARRQVSQALNTRLRTELRWSYGANGAAEDEGDSTRIIVTAAIQPDRARAAIAEAERTVRAVVDGATDASTAGPLREAMRQEILYGLSSSSRIEGALKADLAAGRRPGWRAELLATVDRLSLGDIHAARSLVDWSRAAVHLTGPVPP